MRQPFLDQFVTQWLGSMVDTTRPPWLVLLPENLDNRSDFDNMYALGDLIMTTLLPLCLRVAGHPENAQQLEQCDPIKDSTTAHSVIALPFIDNSPIALLAEPDIVWSQELQDTLCIQYVNTLNDMEQYLGSYLVPDLVCLFLKTRTIP